MKLTRPAGVAAVFASRRLRNRPLVGYFRSFSEREAAGADLGRPGIVAVAAISTPTPRKFPASRPFTGPGAVVAIRFARPSGWTKAMIGNSPFCNIVDKKLAPSTQITAAAADSSAAFPIDEPASSRWNSLDFDIGASPLDERDHRTE
ncbi:MAG: hypothetical protein C3F11_00635 [Methylocystaceae bacterium]|nr:MAG: hypothetical protein C3F11_00635 [Methylocystaceae bacterium]